MRQSNDFRDSDCASWRWHEWARIYTVAGIAVLLCLPAYLQHAVSRSRGMTLWTWEHAALWTAFAVLCWCAVLA